MCSVTKSCPTPCDPMECAHQVSLFINISCSLLMFMSIESVMPSNHLILCHSLLLLPSIFPSIWVLFCFFFPVSWLFASGGQSIAASASASVLPMNIQFPLRLTGLISVANSHLIYKCLAMKLAILQIYGKRQS